MIFPFYFLIEIFFRFVFIYKISGGFKTTKKNEKVGIFVEFNSITLFELCKRSILFYLFEKSFKQNPSEIEFLSAFMTFNSHFLSLSKTNVEF